MSRLPKKHSALAETLARSGRRKDFVLGDAVTVKDCQKDPKLVIELIRAFQAGQRGAAELLVEVYMPFVAKCCKRYSFFYHRDLDDFFQEGRLATLDACARWDFERATSSPSSYVFKYISGYIRRYAMVAESCVRIPVHAYDRKYGTDAKMKTKRSEWMREFQKTLSLASSCWLFSELEGRPLPAGSGVAGAQDSDSEDDGGSLEDVLFDEEEETAEDVLATADLRVSMRASALSVTALLDNRQRDIFQRRFGPDDESETLEQIGAVYGLTRERIRQIESLALGACRDRARKGMHCPPERFDRFDRFEDWAVALAEYVRGPGREQAEWEKRVRSFMVPSRDPSEAA